MSKSQEFKKPKKSQSPPAGSSRLEAGPSTHIDPHGRFVKTPDGLYFVVPDDDGGDFDFTFDCPVRQLTPDSQ